MSPPETSRPGLDPDDATLWGRVAGTTKPLRGQRVAPPPPSPKPIAPDAPNAAAGDGAGAAKPIGPRADTSPAGRRTALPPLAPGAGPGIDQRTAMRLRRGQLAVDARLDLHGLTLEEASRAFSLFVREARESGARCVLVITGKGARPRDASAPSLGQGAVGVLRGALPGWINQPALRPLVLAFCQARPKHGGVGAFYLLLKRRR